MNAFVVKGLLKIGLPVSLFGAGCSLVILQKYPLGIPLIFFSGCLCVLLTLQSFELIFASRDTALSEDSPDDGESNRPSGNRQSDDGMSDDGKSDSGSREHSGHRLPSVAAIERNSDLDTNPYADHANPTNTIAITGRANSRTSEFRLDEEGWLVHERPRRPQDRPDGHSIKRRVEEESEES